MQYTQSIDSSCFAGLLTKEFVAKSVPASSKIDATVESIKGKAALLSLSIFHHQNKDLRLSSSHTFGSIFSEKTYGPGFTKGFSIILAYLMVFEDEGTEGKSPASAEFALKVKEYATGIFESVNAGKTDLAGVRKQAEQFDNFGGYYDRTYLSQTFLKALTPEGVMGCSLVIDPKSGHLIAKVGENFSEELLNAYREEVNSYLTESGKSALKLPFDVGCVIVVYKDELAKFSPEKVQEALSTRVNVSFKKAYVVPARGDNRYASVVSVLMDSPDILSLRLKLGLDELYSEARPLRFTFGAVHNPYLNLKDSELVEKMNNSEALKPLMKFVSAVKA